MQNTPKYSLNSQFCSKTLVPVLDASAKTLVPVLETSLLITRICSTVACELPICIEISNSHRSEN